MNQLMWISLLSGLATGIGGLIVLWFGYPNSKVLAFYLGISTGMMGMVVLVDLLPASIKYGSLYHTSIGLLIGIVLMLIFQSILSVVLSISEHNSYRQMGYFMTLAIALHNIPEGLAIGAGYESQEELGIRVALIIALHNIPEGLGVAATLFLGQLSPLIVLLLPLATGFFIPVGSWISIMVNQILPDWISIGLSIASGAMGYLVIKEIGPESLKLNRLLGQFGMAVGILILYLVHLLNP